jgi:hypothetical protein
MADPTFLREQILLHTNQRKELIPVANGNAPTLPYLLFNARYIGNEIRYMIHNTLQDLGYWSIIVKYLEDVAELDGEKGRFGAVKKRQELIDFVAGMVDQGLELVEQRVKSGVLTDKQLGNFCYRNKVRKLSCLRSKYSMNTIELWRLDRRSACLKGPSRPRTGVCHAVIKSSRRLYAISPT